MTLPDHLHSLVREAKERCMRQCKDPADRNELFVSLSVAFESMVYEGVMDVEMLASLVALVVVFPQQVDK